MSENKHNSSTNRPHGSKVHPPGEAKKKAISNLM